MLAFGREHAVLELNGVIDETAILRNIGEDIEFRVLPADSLSAVEVDPDHRSGGDEYLRQCQGRDDAWRHTRCNRQCDKHGNATGTMSDAPPGEYVKLSVADSGMGISKDLQERIFEPFLRPKRSGKAPGWGLPWYTAS